MGRRFVEAMMSARSTSDVAPWIEILARIGFVAKGLLYATIGVLAGCAGLGRGGGATDIRGAMRELLAVPFGQALLFGIAAGLVGYAVWRVAEGIADPEHKGTSLKGIWLRASYVVRGLLHLWLAYAAVKAAMGHPTSGGGDQSEKATATIIGFPGGSWLVWGAAVGIAAFGGYQLWQAVASRLHRDVNEREVESEAGTWLLVISRIGIASRGIVFVAIGWLLVHAAREHRPSEAGGIADALTEVARLGRWPYIAVAAGLIAYGGYQLLSARYRRIRVLAATAPSAS